MRYPWLTKAKRLDGSVSSVGFYQTRDEAQELADALNTQNQSDAYYSEANAGIPKAEGGAA